MKRRASNLVIAVLVACPFISSCKTWRSVSHPPPPDTISKEERKALDDRVRVLSDYALGVSQELRGQSKESMESYYRSLMRDPRPVELVLRVARYLFGLNDADRVISLLRTALSRNPDESRFHGLLGLAYAQQGKSKKAIESYREAIRLNPRDFAPYQQAAGVHWNEEKPVEAFRILEEASRADLESASDWMELGRQLIRFEGLPNVGDVEAAAALDRVFQALDKESPASFTGRQRLAELYFLSGRMQEAERMFRELADQLPHLLALRQRLFETLLRQSKMEEARKELESMSRVDPTNARIKFLQGTLARDLKDIEGSARYFRQATLLDPDFQPAYLEYSAVMLSLGRPEEALKELDTLRAKVEGSFLAEYYSGLACGELKDYPEAIRHFEAAERISSQSDEPIINAVFYFQWGSFYERAKRYEEAAAAFKKSIEMRPDFAEPYNYLGYMWAEQGVRLKEARRLIRRALKLEPGNAAYLDSMGWVLHQLDRPKQALEYLKQSLDRAEEPDPVILDHLGDVHEALGNREQAVDAWKKSLELEENPEVRSKFGTE